MYHFQSLFKLRITGTPEIYFDNFEFDTEDEVLAERIRKNSKFGQDVWEVDSEVLGEQAREAMSKLAAPKKRGRPPKVQIVTGMRTAEEKEKQE